MINIEQKFVLKEKATIEDSVPSMPFPDKAEYNVTRSVYTGSEHPTTEIVEEAMRNAMLHTSTGDSESLQVADDRLELYYTPKILKLGNFTLGLSKERLISRYSVPTKLAEN